MQLLFVCCVKTVQFNKFVTCTQRDGNNQIQIKILDASSKLRKATVTFVMCILCLSVRPSAWNDSAPTGRIFVNFYIWEFFSKIRWENQSLINILTWVTGTLREGVCAVVIISQRIFPRVKNVLEKNFRETFLEKVLEKIKHILY